MRCGRERAHLYPLSEALILFEFSVRQPTHPPIKLLQDIRHTYKRFSGKYDIAAVSVCSTSLVQVLYVVADDLSLTHRNVFSPFKVDFGSKIQIIKSELENMVNWFYGFLYHRIQQIEEKVANIRDHIDDDPQDNDNLENNNNDNDPADNDDLVDHEP